MFEDDWSELDAVATLDAAVEFDAAENRAALGKLLAALHFADLHGGPVVSSQHVPPAPGRERMVVYGGEGCPAVSEFAPAEFGALLKMSSRSAAAYIGEALALRHRLPRVWAKTLNGEAAVWRARAVARACFNLSEEAAGLVDQRVVRVIDNLSAYGLQKIIDAALMEVDPEAARNAAEERARERGVWVQPSDEHGTKTVYVKAAAGDVIRFEATIADLAWALAMLGDPDTLDARRAKAIRWIADPAAAYELLAAARYLATTPDRPTESEPQDAPAAPGRRDQETGDANVAVRRESAASDDAVRPDPSTTDDVVPADPCIDDLVEPGIDDEADRDTPHPSQSDHLDDLDKLNTADMQRAMAALAWKHGHTNDAPSDSARPDPTVAADNHTDLAANADVEPYSRHALAQRLAGIKQAAYTTGLGARLPSGGRGRAILYVHLTDQTLLSGEGVLRVEQYGPLLAAQLRELLGHDQVVVKPVIDLNDNVSVNAYEIPSRIRERVKLIHPTEPFPYSSAETTSRTYLDHVRPYRPNGPPGQTSTTNLAPATRFHHRVKTHGGWKVEHTTDGALLWITRHGYKFRVDHTGTHRIIE